MEAVTIVHHEYENAATKTDQCITFNNKIFPKLFQTTLTNFKTFEIEKIKIIWGLNSFR